MSHSPLNGGELFSPKPFGTAQSSYRKVSSNFEFAETNQLSVQTSLSQSSYNSSSPISSPLSGSTSSPDHQLMGPFVARSNTSGPPSPSRYFSSVNFQPNEQSLDSHASVTTGHQESHQRAPPVPPPKPAHPGPPPPMPKPRQMNISKAFAALENLSTSNATPPPQSQPSSGQPREAPAMIQQYDNAVQEPLQEFLSLSTKLGGDVETMGNKVKEIFGAQREFLWKAAGQKEPNEEQRAVLMTPTVTILTDIGGFRELKRNTPPFNHLSSVSEGLQAFYWVNVKPTPAPFIKECIDAAMFFTNRVLKENKDGDQTHANWVKSFMQLMNALQTYVRQAHTTGLVWNSAPGSAPSGGSASGGPPPPPAGGPPPPPPPVLPPGLFDTSAKSAESNAREALFSELNKGLDVTKGLKKVTADMQTHKNPALKTQGPVAASSGGNATGSHTPTTPNARPDPPPKTQLENGKQWNVEYHKGNKAIVFEVEDKKQTVYIYKCTDSVIQIKGKCNSVTVDSCKKTSVVFDSLLAQVEIINCQSVQVQTLGAMPTLSIQKTDGCQVYLSKEAINAEIVTSKSSEMNILVPTEDGDFKEFPVPEQYKTVWNGNKLATSVVDIA
uniref:C-CAP/cofactor C-like domain-containing protein n=1 Tax=Plectus sambesii TaxID=2011161 RepID=A0A914WNB2_9BILA